jgi:hypothetical protein
MLLLIIFTLILYKLTILNDAALLNSLVSLILQLEIDKLSIEIIESKGYV